MPYTLSHPLAVVPLKRWCPALFNWPALVIGSMSPDFGYFTSQFELARYAHTWQGMFVVCLPESLLLLAVFYVLRQPVCFILPQPHRTALMPLASAKLKPSLLGAFVAICSVLVGTVTHILWDSLTHYDGWPAEHFVFWRTPLFVVAGTFVPPYALLQLISSIIGGAALIVLYLLWLHRQPIKPTDENRSDAWRYALLAAIVAATLVIALAATYHHTLPFQSGPTFGEFLYWAIVFSTAAFFPALAIASLFAYSVSKLARSTE